MPDNTPPLDVQQALALYELLGHAGAEEVEVGWLSEEAPFRYWARARWGGQAIIAEECPSANLALDGIARKVLHHGQCTSCGRKLSFPHLTPGLCGRVLVTILDANVMTYRRLCDLAVLAAGIEIAEAVLAAGIEIAEAVLEVPEIEEAPDAG